MPKLQLSNTTICWTVIDKVSPDSDRGIKMHSIELVEGTRQEMEDSDRIRVLWAVLAEGASQEMEDRDGLRVLWPVRIELTVTGCI